MTVGTRQHWAGLRLLGERTHCDMLSIIHQRSARLRSKVPRRLHVNKDGFTDAFFADVQTFFPRARVENLFPRLGV